MGVNGYELGGQEEQTMRRGENQLRVKLESLLESETILKKSAEGVIKFIIVGDMWTWEVEREMIKLGWNREESL